MANISRKTAILLFILSVSLFPQVKPTFRNGVAYLSRFIASDYFLKLKGTADDVALTDTLYLRSVKFYRNDYSEALLALTFACLPYNEMHIRIPLIGTPVTVHLPSVANPLFAAKNKNLPSKLFYDSPGNSFGDKDKLSHFFGNAFIEYNFPLFNLSNFMGIFVEKFEETFYVEGAMDKRDLYVNRLGAKFGKTLRDSVNLLPSRFLKKYAYGKK